VSHCEMGGRGLTAWPGSLRNAEPCAGDLGVRFGAEPLLQPALYDPVGAPDCIRHSAFEAGHQVGFGIVG
jgi:hypothetical protein